MLHQAKWFIVSLALHLAVAAVLFVTASRNLQQAPKAILVILDNLDSSDTLRRKVVSSPVKAAVRPIIQSPPAMSKANELGPEQAQRLPSTEGVPNIMDKMLPEHQQTREVPNAASQQITAGTERSTTYNTEPQLVQQGADNRQPSVHKVQQRYLKEHFTYISDLITQQLVYPPMARKMNWSGKVVVAFTIVENGSVEAIRITETSGYSILDKSAMDTVRKVAPFPMPPVRAEIVVPINFIMKR